MSIARVYSWLKDFFSNVWQDWNMLAVYTLKSIINRAICVWYIIKITWNLGENSCSWRNKFLYDCLSIAYSWSSSNDYNAMAFFIIEFLLNNCAVSIRYNFLLASFSIGRNTFCGVASFAKRNLLPFPWIALNVIDYID